MNQTMLDKKYFKDQYIEKLLFTIEALKQDLASETYQKEYYKIFYDQMAQETIDTYIQ